MDKKISFEDINSTLSLRFVSDLDKKELLDTGVFIDSHQGINKSSAYLCTIAGSEIEPFKTDFKNLITKYRI